MSKTAVPLPYASIDIAVMCTERSAGPRTTGVETVGVVSVGFVCTGVDVATRAVTVIAETPCACVPVPVGMKSTVIFVLVEEVAVRTGRIYALVEVPSVNAAPQGMRAKCVASTGAPNSTPVPH